MSCLRIYEYRLRNGVEHRFLFEYSLSKFTLTFWYQSWKSWKDSKGDIKDDVAQDKKKVGDEDSRPDIEPELTPEQKMQLV